jgi:hypothetical protein
MYGRERHTGEPLQIGEEQELSATCKTFSECDPGPEKEIVKKMNRV